MYKTIMESSNQSKSTKRVRKVAKRHNKVNRPKPSTASKALNLRIRTKHSSTSKSIKDTNTEQNDKLSLTPDRQVRSALIAFNKSVKYSESGTIIATDLPTNIFKELIDTLYSKFKVSYKDVYFSYNGKGWARTHSLHMKIFIKPETFVNKKVYPKSNMYSKTKLLKELNLRWDNKLIDVFTDMLQVSIQNESHKHNIVDGTYPELIKGRSSFSMAKYGDLKSIKADLIELEKYTIDRYHTDGYKVDIFPFDSNLVTSRNSNMTEMCSIGEDGEGVCYMTETHSNPDYMQPDTEVYGGESSDSESDESDTGSKSICFLYIITVDEDAYYSVHDNLEIPSKSYKEPKRLYYKEKSKPKRRSSKKTKKTKRTIKS